MSHTHEQPDLAEIELPETGTAKFWDDEVQCTLEKNGDDKWILTGYFRRGKATPLAIIRSRAEVWKARKLGGNETSQHGSWQDAVRWSIS